MWHARVEVRAKKMRLVDDVMVCGISQTVSETV
jgi:hypothetical protein